MGSVLITTAAVALAIGVVLGLLGGGGSILAVPVLIYVLGVESRVALATSLFVVSLSSFTSGLLGPRRKDVVVKAALPFALASMAGAYFGGRLSKYVPVTALLLLFAGLMLVAAVLMWRGRKTTELKDEQPGQLPVMAGAGGFVGILTGMVGAGGGFAVVPALHLLGRLPIHHATGTSLIVVGASAALGFLGHIGSTELDVELLLAFGGFMVLGGQMGARLSTHVPAAGLRKGFAVFVVGMAIFMIVRQFA